MNVDNEQIEEGLRDAPTQTVAMIAVQAIGELSQALYAAGGHDEFSESMVTSVCALLTSVLDGKSANPATALIDASKTLDDALLDEVQRCQHYLAEMTDRTKAAESKALLNELYAGWYLRLRTGSGPEKRFWITDAEDRYIETEDLDALMEDLDEEDESQELVDNDN